MKPRYNLRFQPAKPIVTSAKKKSSSRIIKKSKPNTDEATRRHSLRLTSVNKRSISETIPKWRQVEDESDDESNSYSSNNNDDDFDELLARHHRLMLEEQKDRKLYERYIRDQRTLRRLQCRRTHTAHLKVSTSRRLLRELERERRDAIQDKICSYLANRTIVFRHGSGKKSMNWSNLEEEMPYNRNIGNIHELDVMIDNLNKGMKNSSSTLTAKPRLSVRERQNQRLGSTTSTKPDNPSTPELPPSSSTSPYSIMNSPSLQIVSYSPRVPLVRFTDDPNTRFRMNNNSPRLTCIQNVLSCQNIEISPSRKTFLRSKSTSNNHPESPPTKKRAIEKENFSLNSSPMVSIKYSSSTSSSRTYPNTRKHPIINNSLTTRRQTRLSTNA